MSKLTILALTIHCILHSTPATFFLCVTMMTNYSFAVNQLITIDLNIFTLIVVFPSGTLCLMIAAVLHAYVIVNYYYNVMILANF